MTGDKVFFGVLLMLLSCLFMLCFIATEAQWENNLINRQNIFNEVIMYIVFSSMICFSGILTSMS